ncbi:MAG: helix-turn-helix domain-containing protein, partial [Sphingomonadaceae bacterium]
SAKGTSDRIFALIEARLSDPDLRTGMIAAELGISLRTVQNAFAALATTPSAYIQQRRLELAAERLAAGSSERITEIAYEIGFNDSAYFTRCFRQQYGKSPSEWRARAS